MAEGARLESVFRGNSNVGSNPTLSARFGKFRAKYGAGDVKKYYSKFDVAVLAHTR